MKKLFSLFVAALFCASMWANNTSATFYLAVPAGTVGTNVQYKIKYSGSEWTGPTTMEKLNKLYGERMVYKATYEFPWDGYHNWEWWWNGSQQKSIYAGDWNTDRHDGQMYVYDTETWITYSEAELTDFTYFITGDSALVVDAGFDKSKAWNTNAIMATADEYVISGLKANTEYKLKVITDGVDWDTQKSFYNLNPHTAGLYTEKDGNICFKLATAGNVTVSYNASTSAFSLTGNFSMPSIAINANWGEGWEHPTTLNDNGDGTASVSITLPANTDYQFYMIIGGFNTSNGYSYKSDYYHTEGVVKSSDSNMNLKTDKEGSYTFTWTYANNVFDIAFPSGTAVDNTEVSKKAVKRIVDGQLVIERDGKFYNALGAEMK